MKAYNSFLPALAFGSLLLGATAPCPSHAQAFDGNFVGNSSFEGRMCIGAACTSTETYSTVSTVRLKQVNTAIEFIDTSDPSGRFPGGDWRLEANETGSGGRNLFQLRDQTSATIPFTILGGAPNGAFFINEDGDVGMGTTLPTADLHIKQPNSTAVLRLERTGDFPRFFDLENNGLAVYLRDNGGDFPFVVWDDAPSYALTIGSNSAPSGNVGIGVQDPQAQLHVAGQSMLIQNAGRVNFTLSDTSDPGPDFRTQLTAGTARFSFVGTGAPEMELFQTGDLAIRGRYISAGTTLTVPDYVFDDDYALRPLAEVQSFIDANRHLPGVPSAADIAAEGLDITEMQMTLLKKIEELTLYTLEQEEKMAAQERAMAAQARAMADLKAEMAALKASRN